MITWNEELKQLSAVISEEWDARMAKGHKVVPTQIAEWLIQRQRHLARVIAALTDLVLTIYGMPPGGGQLLSDLYLDADEGAHA